jgi:hypothetical protein
MNSSNLTQKQLRELCGMVRLKLRFLGRLRQRMEQLGFRPDDRLYQATTAAYNAVHALHVECHYLTCPGGVGRSDRGGEQPEEKAASADGRSG